MFCEAKDLKRFLPVFLSCNDPTDQCDWCKRCEKCAFIFLLLSAWLPPDEVVSSVFNGFNMLLLAERRRDFYALVGLAGPKPLDCVGTVAEAAAALHLTAVRYSPYPPVEPTSCSAYRTTSPMPTPGPTVNRRSRRPPSIVSPVRAFASPMPFATPRPAGRLAAPS